MNRDEQRALLGRFVRLHRERIRPDAPGPRRRTPGLRREELAARAGIGVTWCAWIEQGRDISVSPHTLSRLARALALTPAERRYLFELAGRRDPDAPAPTAAASAPQSVAALVQTLPYPAYGLDPVWNLSCWNAPAEHLFAGWLDADGDRNLLRFVFTAPGARALLPDWRDRALRLLAEFRTDSARLIDDARLQELVRSLSARSPDFAREWNAQTVLAREGGTRTFHHPADGVLQYRQYTFSPAERSDHKLVTLIPLPPGTSADERS